MAKTDGSIDCGLLVRRQMRAYLQELKFQGQMDDYLELKGILSSRFLMKGISAEAARAVASWAQVLSN